ncbi:MAG: hypothetical protein ACO1OQ_10230 [Rufibacter sp.]
MLPEINENYGISIMSLFPGWRKELPFIDNKILTSIPEFVKEFEEDYQIWFQWNGREGFVKFERVVLMPNNTYCGLREGGMKVVLNIENIIIDASSKGKVNINPVDRIGKQISEFHFFPAPYKINRILKAIKEGNIPRLITLESNVFPVYSLNIHKWVRIESVFDYFPEQGFLYWTKYKDLNSPNKLRNHALSDSYASDLEVKYQR